MEKWKDIDGFAGYQVSNIGRIRTHSKTTTTQKHGERHWRDRILKQKISKKDNCARIILWKNGKPFTELVHRIVAKTFLGVPTDKRMTVNHKDGNRLNNTVDNLEWLSLADNIRHGFDNGLYTTQKHCVLVNENGDEIRFRSLSQASIFLNRSNNYVATCIKRGSFIARGKNGDKYNIVT